MPSLTIENYTKAIYLLTSQGDRDSASTGALASHLRVSPGSVTSMLKTLHESGLANHRPYEGARLTEEGKKLALRVLRRHRLIELFLSQTLNLSWDEVHEEAEHMEHAVSDLLIDRIDAYLGHPELDPHGDPIPKSDGSIPTQEHAQLSECLAGSSVRLSRVVDQSPEFLRYLTESGLQIGATIRILAADSNAGSIELEVSEKRLSLGKEISERLLVEPVPH